MSLSGKACAILLALDMAEPDGSEKLLVMSDSLSCLQTIENRHFYNPLILEILVMVHGLLSSGHNITLRLCGFRVTSAWRVMWQQMLRRKPLLPSPPSSAIPHSDFKPVINSYAAAKWQKSWDEEMSNKLHKIQPRVGSFRVYCLQRRDELIICRLRVGHTHFTHSYLLKGESPPPPMCVGCDSPFTVEHILVDCVELAISRSKYFNVSSLEELFDTVLKRNLIDFIK
jgi:hypothetical protein